MRRQIFTKVKRQRQERRITIVIPKRRLPEHFGKAPEHGPLFDHAGRIQPQNILWFPFNRPVPNR